MLNMFWQDIKNIPRVEDGDQYLLWLKSPYDHAVLAEWYDPWGVWIPAGSEIDEDDERFGCGCDVPSHFCEIVPPE